MNICPTTILYNNGLHIIEKSINVKRKFQSLSGAFCFGHAAAICQHFNTIDVEVCYTRNREGCGGCEEEQSFWKLYIQ